LAPTRPHPMRTLAIDLGSRRIGLALSDSGGTWASPDSVLTVTDPAQAIEPILKLIQREDVGRVVVGMPLNMDGTTGPAARGTIAWTKTLLSAAVAAGRALNLVFVDERLSSFEAEQQLNQRRREGENLTRKRKKEQLDAVAAAGLLQAYLDGKLAPLDIKP
jgi:putative Holliday junction resolvase